MQPRYLLHNRYRIEKALAVGGFGETYLAIDENPDYPIQRQVVVKHLKPQSNAPGELEIARRLFEAEAMTLAKLGESTDRIPTLYAYFEEQSEFYLVQEYIAGTTLTQELGGRQLSEQKMLEVLQDVLAGLVKVHNQNVIHRDLKPDNIIRRASNQKLVLIDFGAVKAVRQATTFVVSQTIGIGTPGYTPGEQGIGKPQLASDIYAVGAIGLQCLTGIHPYHLLDDVTSEFKWQDKRSVSVLVAQMLNRMVAVRHVDRFANAQMAKAAVDQLLATMSLQPPPVQRVAPQPAATPGVTPSPPAQTPKASTKQSQPPTPAPTKKAYVPPVQPAAPTVKIKTQAPTPNGDSGIDRAGRRKLLKFLGFGGSGLIGTLFLAQFLPKDKELNLRKISFTSVKLDSTGKILKRPAGSAMAFQEDLGNGVALTMVKIPAGKFMMGSPASEKNRGNDESPQHQVTVPEFYLGQMLITQAQWQAIVGSNPSYFKGDSKLPVDSVTWLEAMDFCQKLSQKTGRSYRLPSEAEWEYACRAGTTTPFAFGETITPAVVNYRGNFPYASAAKGEYREKTTPVGMFPANDFGLYDMHGNLWEWCLDEWVNNYSSAPINGSARGDINSRDSGKEVRLLRGGSWHIDARGCRSAIRLIYAASDRHNKVGLRVVAVSARTS